jgi:hypothetical protein
MKFSKTLIRSSSILCPMALALTVVASTPSDAYDDGVCPPNCVCPPNNYGYSCTDSYPYEPDYYGGDWNYGWRRQWDNHRTYGYDHGGWHGGGGHHGR